MKNAKLNLDGKEYELPVVVGSESEVGVDITKLRKESGAITLDTGYGNTGSCESSITFINGEEGILRYRGYRIEDLAENSNFVEVAYLLIHGKLPTQEEYDEFSGEIAHSGMIHEDMKKILDGFPNTSHPMAVLSSMVSALSAYYGDDDSNINRNIIQLFAKLKTIAAFSYKKTIGQPYVYPKSDLSYTGDFLNMMFATPLGDYEVPEVVAKTLDLLLLLHADHEQNCSASTVRMVGSSRANLFASISAGVSALWGPLHGGANQRVIQMLERINEDEGGNFKKYVEMAKDKNSDFKLMGFGHRVYKNFDPRAKIIKKYADDVLNELGIDDPLLDIAKNLEQVALNDDYFVERKLFPNVDFYSGIIYRALGIPTNMFTVMFSIGRLPGWIAQWKEMRHDPRGRIYRPRQVYIGENERKYTPIDQRS
ncbi:MAG TPA: citrate synthase [Balneolales bacterium]|nr:citrate synthase [Balneolales bacterium]